MANINQIFFYEITRALLLSVGVSAALIVLMHLTRLDWLRSGIVASILVNLFFWIFYPILVVAKLNPNLFLKLGQALIILPLPIIAIVSIWIVVRFLKDAEPVNVILNVTGLALVAFLVGRILFINVPSFNWRSINPGEISKLPSPVNNAVLSADRPDIYYIILDGYGREDLLSQVIGYDNSPFVRQLIEKGFFVPSASTSNYSNTTPSLSSSLNFTYLTDLGLPIGTDSFDYRPLRQSISHNRLGAFLESQGYRIVQFETGFQHTEFKGTGEYFQLEGGPTYFESLLLSRSFSWLWTKEAFAKRYNSRINDAFTQLSDLSEISSPKFVFVHVLALHPPFVFGPDGEIVNQATAIELDTNNAGNLQREIDGYRDQLQYINTRVLEAVDHILRNSRIEPVIILQGDHGSGIYLDWRSAENTCFNEHMAILNAYYMPLGKSKFLYDTITPVNSFRVVLNAYFGQKLPLLEDRNYFSLWESPYQVMDVTGQVGKCPFLE